MALQKRYVLPVAVIAGVVGMTGVSLQVAQADSDNPATSLTQKIAERFNLNQEEVQKVFDENHAEREQERKAQYEQSLQTLVDEGKLTADQKNALVQKHAEHEAQKDTDREAMKDLTPEERKKLHEEKKAEMDTWLTEQGIEPSILPQRKGGPGEHKGSGGEGHDRGGESKE